MTAPDMVCCPLLPVPALVALLVQHAPTAHSSAARPWLNSFCVLGHGMLLRQHQRTNAAYARTLSRLVTTVCTVFAYPRAHSSLPYWLLAHLDGYSHPTYTAAHFTAHAFLRAYTAGFRAFKPLRYIPGCWFSSGCAIVSRHHTGQNHPFACTLRVPTLSFAVAKFSHYARSRTCWFTGIFTHTRVRLVYRSVALFIPHHFVLLTRARSDRISGGFSGHELDHTRCILPSALWFRSWFAVNGFAEALA